MSLGPEPLSSDHCGFVRQYAISCLQALINTRPELLGSFLEQATPVLLACVRRETDEGALATALNACICLLRQVKQRSDPSSVEMEQYIADIAEATLQRLQVVKRSYSITIDCLNLLTEVGLLAPRLLAAEGRVPHLLAACRRAFLNTCLEDHRLEVLDLIRDVLPLLSPFSVHEHSLEVVAICCLTSTHNINEEVQRRSFLVLKSLVARLISLGSLHHYCESIYASYAQQLGSTQRPGEQARALSCMALVVAHSGQFMPTSSLHCLQVLVDWLQHQRQHEPQMAALEALTMIVSLGMGLGPYIETCLANLAALLRLSKQPDIKDSALALLDALVKCNGGGLSQQIIELLLQEFLALLVKFENLASGALKVLSSLYANCPVPISSPQILQLLELPSLEWTKHEAAIDFFSSFARADAASCERVMMHLIHAGPNEAYTVQTSVAKCVAAVAATRPRQDVFRLVAQLMPQLQVPCSQTFVLHCLGDIGKFHDLTHFEHLEEYILGNLENHDQDMRSACVYALGNVALGNIPRNVPYLLCLIREQKDKTFLLQALTQTLSSHSHKERLTPVVPLIWRELLVHFEDDLAMVYPLAECVGALCRLAPAQFLPRLLDLLSHKVAPCRLVAICAVNRVIFANPPQESLYDFFRPNIHKMFHLLEDLDVLVREKAFLTFHWTLQLKPVLIRDSLHVTVPYIYRNTQPVECIQVTEFGLPSTKMDPTSECRLVVFLCLKSLLEKWADRINLFEFLVHVACGLHDRQSCVIRVACSIVESLALLYPTVVTAKMNAIIEALFKAFPADVKRENEYSLLKVVATVGTIEVIGRNAKWKELLNSIEHLRNGLEYIKANVQFHHRVKGTKPLDQVKAKEEANGNKRMASPGCEPQIAFQGKRVKTARETENTLPEITDTE